MRIRTAGILLGLMALIGTGAAGGCGSSSAGSSSGSENLTVLAAASLTETFNQLGKQFERAHPGTKVTLSYGGSSTLAQQIVQGAPADVFAAASPTTMKTVTDAGQAAGSPTVFVRNQLVIAVAPGNPKGITSLADLAKPGLKVVLCEDAVPCGAAAGKALAVAHVRLSPASKEQDVKAALAKVSLGEADAALVYRTDVKSADGQVDGIEFPESAEAINDYPIVALKHAKDAKLADEFVAFVQTAPALSVLTAAGFQAP